MRLRLGALEVRFGADRLTARPDFMRLLRAAETRVQSRYPTLHAEAIGYVEVWEDPARREAELCKLHACLRASGDGLAGIDFLVRPYDATDDPDLWRTAHQWADRAASAGLGVTMHVGEFGTTSIGPALGTPGLRRIGHGTHIADDHALLEKLARSGVTLECPLTCNVVLGSAPSFEDHPIRRYVEHGFPVTLATDLPMHVCTTIGREYAVAALLDFSPAELLGFTRNALAASFTPSSRKAMLLGELDISIQLSRRTERSAADRDLQPAMVGVISHRSPRIRPELRAHGAGMCSKQAWHTPALMLQLQLGQLAPRSAGWPIHGTSNSVPHCGQRTRESLTASTSRQRACSRAPTLSNSSPSSMPRASRR
jgi:hypothetical protein